MAVKLILQFEFITRDQLDVVFIREYKKGTLFVVDIVIPSDLDISLGLALLVLLVVVCLKLDQGLENLFVLLWVLVSEENWLL